MKEIHVKALQRAVAAAAEAIVKNEPYLTQVDSIIGDGDHGFGMKQGFTAVKKLLAREKYAYADDLMKAVGIELVKTMGGASGVIFGTMFIGGLKQLGHGETVSALALSQYFLEGERAIERRGKARPGQKTMIDALLPAAEAMVQGAREGATVKEALGLGAGAAQKGVEASKAMQSRVGRSKNFRAATIGLPDPGAISTGIIFQALYEAV